MWSTPIPGMAISFKFGPTLSMNRITSYNVCYTKLLRHYRTTLRLTGAEIEHRNRVIRSLTAFTFQTSRLTDPAALFKLALSQAMDTARAQTGAIVLIDQETKMLTLGAHRELTSDLVYILTGRQFDLAARALMPHLVDGKGSYNFV